MAPDDTRSKILEAAARLFHEQGYNATGVSTILREAGVNAGSMYHFFPSKEALLVGVLERYRGMLEDVLMKPVEAAEPDPVERIFKLLANYRAWLTPINFSMGCPIGNLALEAGDNNQQVRELVNSNFDGWAAVIKRWLVEAGPRLPDGVDREELSRFVLTVLEGGIMQARAAGSVKPYDESVSQLRAYLTLLLDRAVGVASGSGASRAVKPGRPKRGGVKRGRP